MTEQWQDPWDSPQLFATPEAEEVPWYNADDRIEQMRAMRVERLKARYYCPACGEVGYGFKSFLKGWIVETHSRCLPAEGRHDYYYKRCPGGAIDPERDKAP